MFGMFAYRLVAGVLSPMMVVGTIDSPDSIALAILSSDRKGRTVPGVVVDDASPEAEHWFTFAQVARAARKAATPVVIGRTVDISTQSKRFQTELARLTGRTLVSIVTADWRLDNEQYSSNELDDIAAALVANYTN